MLGDGLICDAAAASEPQHMHLRPEGRGNQISPRRCRWTRQGCNNGARPKYTAANPEKNCTGGSPAEKPRKSLTPRRATRASRSGARRAGRPQRDFGSLKKVCQSKCIMRRAPASASGGGVHTLPSVPWFSFCVWFVYQWFLLNHSPSGARRVCFIWCPNWTRRTAWKILNSSRRGWRSARA